MSKKETRRAAREAFPKAKNPPAKRNYGQRSRPSRPSSASRSSSGSRRATGSTYRPGAPRPASIKRALIWGGGMAVVYFVFIQWIWKSGGTTLGNLIVAIASFVVFAGVVYAVDHFKYQRYLRKKGPSK